MNLDYEKYLIEFAIRRSIRYHDRRKAFFETSHAVLMFFIVLLSSGTIVTLLNDFGKPQWCIAINLTVTVLATLDLVVGFSRRAKEHEVLKKQFHDLLIDMQTSHDLTQDKLGNWKRKRFNIEAEEPPIYRALDVSCHNEEARALDCKRSERFQIHRLEKLLMHFFRFADTDWKRFPDKE